MKYYLIAGEASGDLHGSNLIKGLRAKDPDASFRFRGGDRMSEAAGGAGMLVRHYKEGAVMGLTDVVASLPRILSDMDACCKDILAWKPDALILIDYPGFNMRVAKRLHGKVRVYYYIAPKTWASREGRNAQIRKYVDRMFIVFPFEQDYFAENGIPCIYEGNPLLDAVDSHPFSRPVEGSYVALLPGSRRGEIKRTLPLCVRAARRNGWRLVVAQAPAVEADFYRSLEPDIELVQGRTYDILKYADAAIVNSGTASLEAALIGTPQVVCWSTTRFTAWVARHILKVMEHVRFISLANLILGREIFRELIQEDFNEERLSLEVERLADPDVRSRMASDYVEVRQRLGNGGASERVAARMMESINSSI